MNSKLQECLCVRLQRWRVLPSVWSTGQWGWSRRGWEIHPARSTRSSPTWFHTERNLLSSENTSQLLMIHKTRKPFRLKTPTVGDGTHLQARCSLLCCFLDGSQQDVTLWERLSSCKQEVRGSLSVLKLQNNSFFTNTLPSEQFP